MMVYGYARVSTIGQTLATQKDMLIKAGVKRLYAEKVSGVATKRPELERVLDRLEAGDVVIVCKLDRLARSTLDLLRIIDRIETAGAHIKSLGDPMVDTTSPHGKLLLGILSCISDFERSLILERTNEGRARALANGVQFGRKPKLTHHQRREAMRRLAAGETTREIALSYNVSHMTIARLKPAGTATATAT
jgi:DNA invertase Pin-like site-specific DNA recombinase